MSNELNEQILAEMNDETILVSMMDVAINSENARRINDIDNARKFLKKRNILMNEALDRMSRHQHINPYF